VLPESLALVCECQNSCINLSLSDSCISTGLDQLPLRYGWTRVNILNIYALCRIDDISWGTKGLDSGASSQNSALKDSWKLLKFVHVGKYVFWNIVIGVLILSFGSSYTPRFFITIIMVGLMASSLGIKIFVGCIYMIKYKLSTFGCCQ
jgi:hypothetical protein